MKQKKQSKWKKVTFSQVKAPILIGAFSLRKINKPNSEKGLKLFMNSSSF